MIARILIACQAKVHHAMGLATLWRQSITTAIDFNRATFRNETGDLTFACYSMCQSVHELLLRNDPLDAVGRESERGLDFIRKPGFRDMADAHREPATLHRHRARMDRDLLHLQRRAVRRDGPSAILTRKKLKSP
jgi:hypothetical protein